MPVFRLPLRRRRARGFPERGGSRSRTTAPPGRNTHRGRRTGSWARQLRPVPRGPKLRPRRACRAGAHGTGHAKGSKGRPGRRFPAWRFAESRHRDRLSAPRQAWRRFHQADKYAKWIASLARASILERPDDLVGDVDARARPHDLLVLKHDVDFFGLGDLPHGPVGTFEDSFEFLLAPLAEILVEFPLSALKVPVHITEFAFALLPLRVRHRQGVLLQVLLHLLQLLRHPREVLPALGEFLLQFLLGPLRCRRFLQNPLQADKPDARLGESWADEAEGCREGPTD